MRIHSRYLVSQFLVPFLLAILGFSVLILIIQVFDELHYVMQQKPGFLVTVEYYFLKVPALLLQIMPIAVLFGVLFSLGSLGKGSELIAMRAGGVSIFMVARPILLCGTLVFFLTILFNEIVVPKTNHLQYQIRLHDIERRPPIETTSRSNIYMMGANNEMYHIDFFDGTTNTMTNVIVLGFDNGIQLKTRVDAERAHYENGQWIFSKGYFRVFDETGAELSCQPFEQMSFPFSEKPQDFLKEEVQPWELNMVDLYAHIQQLELSGTDAHKELVEFYKKIAFPFACVILALLGVPWGWSLGKYSGVASSFGICMLVAFSYIGGMQIFQTLGDSGTLPPFFSMWIANFIFAAGGIWMLLRRNR